MKNHNIKYWLTLILFYCLSNFISNNLLFCRVIIEDRKIYIQNSNIVLELEKHVSDVIYLRKLSLIQGQSIIQVPELDWSKGQICPLWQLEFYKPEENFNSNSAKFIDWKVKENKDFIYIILTWSKVSVSDIYEITALIILEKKSNKTIWNLTVSSKNKMKFIFRRVVFPIIGDIVHSSNKGKINLAVPAYWGRLYEQAEISDYYAVYPSAEASMQFMAYFNNTTKDGIYISTNDNSGLYKIFSNHKGNSQYPYARAELSIFPPNYPSQVWRTPFTIEVVPYKGDWYDAGKMYRKWAIGNAPWCKSNSERSCDRLLKNMLWIEGNLDPKKLNNFNDGKLSSIIENFHKFFNCPMGVHLYNWHFYPFDSMYPYYFPAKDGFKKFVGTLSEFGIVTLPYINGRITDLEIINQDRNLSESACAIASNKENLYKINSYHGTNFVAMCPSTEHWKKTLISITDSLRENYWIDAIYFDQIGNDPPVKCISQKHGHINDPDDKFFYSSGTHWYTGYKDILQSIKSKANLKSESFYITENSAELWNDFFDGHLMIEYSIRDTWHNFKIIPLYPIVYSGYTTTVGLSYFNPPYKKYMNTLNYKLSLNFLWGSQLGRIKIDDFEQNSILMNFLKNLVLVRSKVVNYINYGEMLSDPNIIDFSDKILIHEMIPSDDSKYKSIEWNESPILTSFWQLNSDSAVALLTNFSENDYTNKTVIINVNFSEYCMANGRYRVIEHSPNKDVMREIYITEGEGTFTLQIPPYHARAIEFIHL